MRVNPSTRQLALRGGAASATLNAGQRREASIDIEQAQLNMRAGYVAGAPGVLVSGLVWLAAGIGWAGQGARLAFTVLFLGGMLIFPLSAVISRFAFRAPAVAKDNPLNRLGLESTMPLFAGLLIAYVLLPISPPLAIALFAVTVGARYFGFATLYGDRGFWVLGSAIALVGAAFALGWIRGGLNVAMCVGIVEIGFTGLLLVRWRRRG